MPQPAYERPTVTELSRFDAVEKCTARQLDLDREMEQLYVQHRTAKRALTDLYEFRRKCFVP